MRVSEIPIDVRLAVALINSTKKELLCSEEMLILVSLLSVGNIWYANKDSGFVIKSKKKLGAKEGDHITLINIYLRYKYAKDKKGLCNENGLNENAIKAAISINQ